MEITKEKSISFKNIPIGPIIMLILISALIFVGYSFYQQKINKVSYIVTSPIPPNIDIEFLKSNEFNSLEGFPLYIDWTEDIGIVPGKEDPFK